MKLAFGLQIKKLITDHTFEILELRFLIITTDVQYVKAMEMPGIEPGAFHMQSERSTTELHPLFE
jgi:hypothetical protein